jgi:thiol-disulfide isomerase/thioredoxin
MMLMFICGTSYGQDFINSNNFDKKIAKDIVVVEFWAGWNAHNEFKELIKLKDCVVYRIDIATYMDVQMAYDVSAIPTVIIFDNGEEKERFKPNVMFQLDASKKTVQNSVDTLTLNKFQ